MTAWEILFASDVGLMSLFVIAFIICMAFFLVIFVRGKMRKEEEQQQQQRIKG